MSTYYVSESTWNFLCDVCLIMYSLTLVIIWLQSYSLSSIISDEDLLQILNLPILVVLDEAYIEFSGLQSKMKWVKNHENLIVLRTFSKRAGKECSICMLSYQS